MARRSGIGSGRLFSSRAAPLRGGRPGKILNNHHVTPAQAPSEGRAAMRAAKARGRGRPIWKYRRGLGRANRHVRRSVHSKQVKPDHIAPDIPDGWRRITRAEWEKLRWGWLKAVRHDTALNATARLLAVELVLEWANRDTSRCDPQVGDLARDLGLSDDTIKRALRSLVAAKWISKETGRGPGARFKIVFLTRAQIVPLKGADAAREGGKYAPLKGGKYAPLSEQRRGQICTERGANMHPPYIKDKPCKNHKGAGGARKPSQNPMVIADAMRAVAAWRNGHSRAFEDQPKWVIDHVIAADLLEQAELALTGLAGEGAAR